MTSYGQCPRGGVLVNVQEWGCFSIFWRADDVTRTMFKGCVCVLVNVFTPPPPPPPLRKSCIRACNMPSRSVEIKQPPQRRPKLAIHCRVRRGSRIFCRGGGGSTTAVYCGRLWRPCTAGAFGARGDGGSRVDKHQIKVHSVHRIFRAIFLIFFFC